MFFILFSFCLNKQPTLKTKNIINSKDVLNNFLNNNYNVNDTNILLDTSNSIGSWLHAQNITNESQNFILNQNELINQSETLNYRLREEKQTLYHPKKQLYLNLLLLNLAFLILFFLYVDHCNFCISLTSGILGMMLDMFLRRFRSH